MPTGPIIDTQCEWCLTQRFIAFQRICCTISDQHLIIPSHQYYLSTPETNPGHSVCHYRVPTVRQQFVAWVRMTLVSLAVKLVMNDLQEVELVKSLKGSMARLLATTAEEDVCRRGSYYSWQCQSRGHLPRMSPRHCTDSPLPCTGTDSLPAINTTATGHPHYH